MIGKQVQLLMPEGELVKLSLESGPFVWSVYEGVVDGKDSFVVQHHSRGYPTQMLNSWRTDSRNSLTYNPEENLVNLTSAISLVRYDIDNPKHKKLVAILKEKDIWEEFVGSFI